MDSGRPKEFKISELPGDINDFCRFRLKIRKAFNASNDKEEFVTSLVKLGTKSIMGAESNIRALSSCHSIPPEHAVLPRPRRIDWKIPNYLVHRTLAKPGRELIRLQCPSLFTESAHNQASLISPSRRPPAMSISSVESSLVEIPIHRQFSISNINPLHLTGGILSTSMEAKQEMAQSYNRIVQAEESSNNIHVKDVAVIPPKRQVDKVITKILRSIKKVELPRDHIFKFMDRSGRVCYQCAICFKYFGGQLANIKVHLRIHTGEKPYRCKVCGRHFRQSAHLTNHSYVHSGTTHHEWKILPQAANQTDFPVATHAAPKE